MTDQARGPRLTVILCFLALSITPPNLVKTMCYQKLDRERLYRRFTLKKFSHIFEPEQSSSEPDVDSTETLDAVDTWEERIGNTDWY